MPTPTPPTKLASCFQKFLELDRAVQGDTERLNSVVAYTATLKRVADEARIAFYARLTLEDFKRWVAARTELYAADPCSQEFSRTFGALSVRQGGNEGAAQVIAECLTAIKVSLQGQVQKFTEETAELSERILGRKTIGADHPALAELHREITTLENAVHHIENSEQQEDQAWSDHHARISDWIQNGRTN